MKFVTLNIEREHHIELVISFLSRERPDVACLQEVRYDDLPAITQATEMHAAFAPMTRVRGIHPPYALAEEGVAILAREQLADVQRTYYFGGEGEVPLFEDDKNRDIVWQVLLTAAVEHAGATYRVGTTHFMKSLRALPDDLQRERMPLLLHALEAHDDLFFSGDFNIPRGTELYHALAARYHDHVPAAYTNSIDPELHRTKGLSFMIDYLWSTPQYATTDVSMVCGVSDHCALTAEVTRT